MRILCFGDSNTWGYDPRCWLGDQYDAPWPALLAQITGWTVVNDGMNGREIPRRRILLPRETDLLIVMLGTNDLLQGASPEETARRMNAFLTELSYPRERILLIAPPPMKRGAWVDSQTLFDGSYQLGMHYHRIADQLGIRFADAGEWAITLSYDGVHFTEEGHAVFAGSLYELLNDMDINIRYSLDCNQ